MTLEELKKKRALNLANNKKQTSSSLNEFDENRGVLAQALSNVDESGIQLLKDITTPIFHPIQTMITGTAKSQRLNNDFITGMEL